MIHLTGRTDGFPDYLEDGASTRATFATYPHGIGDGTATWTPGRLDIDDQGVLYFADTVFYCNRKINPDRVGCVAHFALDLFVQDLKV